jgi:hypothetical protein
MHSSVTHATVDEDHRTLHGEMAEPADGSAEQIAAGHRYGAERWCCEYPAVKTDSAVGRVDMDARTGPPADEITPPD